MKYPCSECLVDPICNEPCNNLILFSDHISNYRSIKKHYISTRSRFERLRSCILNFGGHAERIVRIESDMLFKYSWINMHKETL
jgi:hypothetical protein